MFNTYSFSGMTMVLDSPIGPFILNGVGIGELQIEMEGDKTAHEKAADGTIMVSKIAGNNAILNISCQQTSLLHKFLLMWYNTLDADPTGILWAATVGTFVSITDGVSGNFLGVSPQKRAPQPYQAQGQMVRWPLMVAEVNIEPF